MWFLSEIDSHIIINAFHKGFQMFDNKAVSFGTNPIQNVIRISQTKKHNIEIPCPDEENIYNKK